jgi:hypothetical protein
MWEETFGDCPEVPITLISFLSSSDIQLSTYLLEASMVILLHCCVAEDTFCVTSDSILRHVSTSGWQGMKAQSDGLFSEDIFGVFPHSATGAC